MTPFVDLTEREREIAHANYAAFKRRLERERASAQFARLADMTRNLPPPTDAEVAAYLDRVHQGVR